MIQVSEIFQSEIIISEISNLLRNDRHVAIGAASPIPGSAALLAEEERKNSDSKLKVTILHSQKFNNFTDGSRELFDASAQGRIDTFFLGGVQIDGEANINLVGTGRYPKLNKRFSGSFGSALMYFVVPKIILFREEHTPRTLVKKVDFISAPGISPPNVYRPGGPKYLITNKALFSFNTKDKNFKIEKINPEFTLDEVIKSTGFEFKTNKNLKYFTMPSQKRIDILRNIIAPKVLNFYPQFAKKLWFN